MESRHSNKNNIKQQNQSHVFSECICERGYSNIICKGCGFWAKGRVRHHCPQHPKIIFLLDYTQCPRCKSYDFMLEEI